MKKYIFPFGCATYITHFISTVEFSFFFSHPIPPNPSGLTFPEFYKGYIKLSITLFITKISLLI